MRRGRSAADLEVHSRLARGRRIAGEGVVGIAGGTVVGEGTAGEEEDIAVEAEGNWRSLAEEGLDGSHSLAAVEAGPIVPEEDRGDLPGRGLVLDTC